MTGISQTLHVALLESLGESLIWHSPVKDKPLCVDLALPNPPRLRIYMYSLVASGGKVRLTEYKAVLRLRGQPVGEYASFDHSDGRLALVIGYRSDLDVYVMWDATLHHRFKNGGNIQVKDSTVLAAAAVGHAEQLRPLSSGATELVIACQSSNLVQAINHRVAWSGSIQAEREREEWWATSLH